MAPDRYRLILMVLLIGSLPLFGRVAGAAEIEATMILASNEAAAQDGRLERIEYRLHRVFKFKSYKFIDRKSVNINLPGNAGMKLGGGYSLKFDAAKAKGGVRAKVQWTQGRKSLVNSSVTLKKGSPVILGGIPHKGGKLIVVISSK